MRNLGEIMTLCFLMLSLFYIIIMAGEVISVTYDRSNQPCYSVWDSNCEIITMTKF